MRIVKFEIDSDEIELIPLADLHIGNPFCDTELIKEVCEYVAKTPNCYTILNGDICETVTRSSVGNIYETTSPQDQIVTACYYLRPIAEQKKIINILSGNHENRMLKDTGLSMTDMLLAHLLQYDDTLNDRYCADGAYTFLIMNGRKSGGRNFRMCVTIYNTHGHGGGSKIGGKIQKLDDTYIPADIIIKSHTHVPETHRGVYFNVNPNEYTVKEKPVVYCNTGAYLKFGGYGERAGYKPLSRAVPVIKIKNRRERSKGKEFYKTYIECTIKEHLGD